MMNDIAVDFGTWMKAKRKEKKWSQERLGMKTGYHANSIRRFEQGCQFPPLDMAEKIINVLGAELIINDGTRD